MPFPESIELCRMGYSRVLLGEQKRVEFDSHIRCRRKTRQRGVTDTCCWVCTEEQTLEMEAFHRSSGGDLFEVSLPSWEGITDTSARFDTPLTLNPVSEHYEITASLYIPEPPMMDTETLWEKLLELIGVADNGFGLPIFFWVNINWGVLWNTGITDSSFVDPVNTFVNETWPGYWVKSG